MIDYAIPDSGGRYHLFIGTPDGQQFEMLADDEETLREALTAFATLCAKTQSLSESILVAHEEFPPDSEYDPGDFQSFAQRQQEEN